MKRTLTTLATHSSIIIVMLTVVFGTFQPLLAQADTSSVFTTGTTPVQNTSNPVTGTADTSGGVAAVTPTSAAVTTPTNLSSGSFPTTVPSGNVLPAGSVNPTGATQTPSKISGCALWGTGSILSGGDWAQCITDVVYVFTVGIGSGFAYVSAWFFDLTIQLSLNSAAYSLTFISQGWTTARDIANMAFLFILIYIAFLIMFQAETTGTIPLLTAVIIVALLVNFSFFLTRLVIDAGNILSIQFYNAITEPSLASTASGGGIQGAVSTATTALGGGATTKDLTASIMGMLNLQGLLSNPSFQAFQGSTNYTFLTVLISLTFLYICTGIMLWILTIMFASVGVKFLFRIVALWFLIIAAPLAFVAYAVPGLRPYYNQWLSMLISNAFYPVAFMFIFLILVNFSNQLSGTGQNGLIGGIFSGLQQQAASGFISSIAVSVANVGIRMGFVIAVLWVGLEASKRIGVMGGEMANHFGAWAGGKMIGTSGFASRQTFGRGAYALSRTEGFRNWADRSAVGRTLWTATDKVARGSHDVRGLPGGKALKDVVGEAGGKGGFGAQVEARAKRVEETAKKLRNDDTDKAKRRRQFDQDFERGDIRDDQGNPTNLAGVTYEVAVTNAARALQSSTEREQQATTALAQATQNLETYERSIARLTPQQRQTPNVQNRLQQFEGARDRAQNELDGSTVGRRRAITRQEQLTQVGVQRNEHIQQNQENRRRVEAYATEMARPRAANLWWPSKGSLAGSEKARHLVNRNENDRLIDAIRELRTTQQEPDH